MEMFYFSLIVLGVTAVTGLTMWLIKYVKTNFKISSSDIVGTIDMTQLVMTYIRTTLKNNNIDITKVNLIAPVILEGFEYIKVLAEHQTEEEVLEDALALIKDIAKKFRIIISAEEYAIVQVVLKQVYDLYLVNLKK